MASDNTIKIVTVESGMSGQPTLSEMLAEISGLEIVAHTTNAREAQSIVDANHIDLVIVDMGFSDNGGIALTREIREKHPQVRLLILTASDSPEDIFAAMNAGADGYVLKGNTARALESAIRSVRLGAVWLDPGIAQQVLHVMETTAAKNPAPSREIPTGLMILPLMPEDKATLFEVAGSSCADGVCMVDPSFFRKLRRFSQTS